MRGAWLAAWLWTLASLLPLPARACAERGFQVLFADGLEDCQRDQSRFVRLANDRQIDGTSAVVVLSHGFTLSSAAPVLIVADGRYFPLDAPAGSIRIRINGDESASSVPITDWGSSQRPMMHAFNVLASATLPAGNHLVELVASAHPSRPGRFMVGAGSGMSVLVQPYSHLTVSGFDAASPIIDVTTYDPANGIDVIEGALDRPFLNLLQHRVGNRSGRPVWSVGMVSGRGFNACNNGIDNGFGDALLGLFGNGICQGTENAAWSVNDLHPDAELQGAMMAHSVHALQPGEDLDLVLAGSELAFGSDQGGSSSGAHENGVCWAMGNVRMISATGGTVAGRAPTGPNRLCSTYTWRCVATTLDSAGCPQAGTDVVLSSAQINIPSGHDGIVLFNARTRIQADNGDEFATAALGIRINGVPRGAVGTQQLANGAAEASRTLSASVLTTPGDGGGVLTPGVHLVEVTLRISGTRLQFPSAPEDLALSWID
ncbi:MAG: hypothetical protein KDI48_05010 [Xanthomonadales bacterium]|nr:hypothetical protein [Xanthomonadales bacterium]